MNGFFDTDLHSVSWTKNPLGLTASWVAKCQLTSWRSVSKKPRTRVFIIHHCEKTRERRARECMKIEVRLDNVIRISDFCPVCLFYMSFGLLFHQNENEVVLNSTKSRKTLFRYTDNSLKMIILWLRKCLSSIFFLNIFHLVRIRQLFGTYVFIQRSGKLLMLALIILV